LTSIPIDGQHRFMTTAAAERLVSAGVPAPASAPVGKPHQQVPLTRRRTVDLMRSANMQCRSCH
jgi:hypothetical protein